MQIRTITVDLGERERKAAAASRRFPCTISSENPVARRSWTGETWHEVLSHARGAVDLSRAPLPVIEGHDRSRTNVGIIEGLKLDGTRLRGELVLGASARAQELAADIAEGIVRNLSVGYSIETEERDEKAKRITARKWTPHEVSIVSVPADTTVGIGRSAGRSIMEPQNPPTPQPPAPDEATRAAVELATRTERERVTAIRSLVTRHDLGDAFGNDLVTRGVPLEQVRALVLERLVQRQEAQGEIRNHLPLEELEGRRDYQARIVPGNDYREDFRAAAVDALLIRAGIRVEKPHAAARDVSASVYDLARVCLSRSGKSGSRWYGGESRGPELLKRAAGTGDFPAILEGALHASVRSGYESEPASHRAWVRVAPFSDFREAKRPILSSAPDLDKLGEYAEYKHGYFKDDGTGYTIAKYGKIVALTWEALVNDNLGQFLRVQPALGVAARRKEADIVYATFSENSGAGPTMNDTKALFHVDHANLGTSAAFDATQLGKGREFLRKMRAVAAAGQTAGGYLSLVPRFLLVPPEKETAAEILLANAARPAAGADKTVAKWVASLDLVVEPRLASTAVYLLADSSQIDTCELGLLEENMSGPYLETEQGFGTDESRWKIRHTAGAKWIDWRGAVKLPVT